MISLTTITNDKVSGRLGNKLFQIACVIGITETEGNSFVLPYWQYEDTFLNIPVDKPENIKVDMVLKEPHFHYFDIPLIGDKNVDFRGYFQSEKYFEHCRDKVRYYFTPNDTIKEVVNIKWEEIKTKLGYPEKICFIQTRLDDDYNNDFHGVLPKSYFETAMKKFPDFKFIMFSDRLDRAKNIFNDPRILFVENTTPVVDMFLAAKCNNAIIPNSTFSWWSAWFMESPQKVIAPKDWFGPRAAPSHNTKDLYLKNWKLL